MVLISLSTLSPQNDEGSSQIRIRVIAGKSLAKKDIFGASDPYVRIDLNTLNGDTPIDSVLTKTKKKVSKLPLERLIDVTARLNSSNFTVFHLLLLDTKPIVE
jgi:C2 domain